MFLPPALVGLLLVIILTSTAGPSATPDGAVYVDVARHIAAGEGPLATNIHGEATFVMTWPPLFPALIAPGVALGIAPQEVARWLNAAAHGLCAVLIGLLVLRITADRRGALIAAWLAAIATPLLRSSSYVGSEAVFLALLLGGTLCLLTFAEKNSRRALIMGGLLLGLAIMQRYAGYAFAGAALIWVLQLPGDRRARVLRGALFALAVAPLPLGWRVAGALHAGELDSRVVNFIWLSTLHFEATGHGIAAWVAPKLLPRHLKALVAIAVSGAMVWGCVVAVRDRLRGSVLSPAALLFALMAGCYAALLGVTFLWLDHDLMPEERLLEPLLALLLVTLVWTWSRSKAAVRKGWLGVIVLVGLGYVVGFYDLHIGTRSGFGFAAERWRESALIEAVQKLPDEASLYSNRREALIYHTGHAVAGVPADDVIDNLRPPRQAKPFPDAAAARAELRQTLRRGGYVVWFYDVPGELELSTAMRELDLTVAARFPDGLLLQTASARK